MPLDYERLAHLPALAGFTPEEIEAFFAISQRLTAKAGERIIRAGDAADCFYILARGGLEVVVEASGHPLPVASLGRGHLVGEMPLIYHQPVRQADVYTTEECHLFRWMYADYEALAGEHPALVKKFRANLGKIAAARSWTTGASTPAAPPRPVASSQLPPAANSPISATAPASATRRTPTSSPLELPSDSLPLRATGQVSSRPIEESAHATLKRASTFVGFTDDELRQVETIALPLDVEPDQPVCLTGDPADSFFVVARGQVEVRILKADKDFPLARLGPGQVFGEMALVYKQPTRSATVIAVEASRLLRVGFDDYNRLILGLPEIGRKLKNNLSRVAASRSWSLDADEARALKERTGQD